MPTLFLFTVGIASIVYLLVLARVRFRGTKTRTGNRPARLRTLQFR